MYAWSACHSSFTDTRSNDDWRARVRLFFVMSIQKYIAEFHLLSIENLFNFILFGHGQSIRSFEWSHTTHINCKIHSDFFFLGVLALHSAFSLYFAPCYTAPATHMYESALRMKSKSRFGYVNSMRVYLFMHARLIYWKQLSTLHELVANGRQFLFPLIWLSAAADGFKIWSQIQSIFKCVEFYSFHSNQQDSLSAQQFRECIRCWSCVCSHIFSQRYGRVCANGLILFEHFSGKIGQKTISFNELDQ